MPENRIEVVHQDATGLKFYDPATGEDIRLTQNKCLVVNSTTADPAAPVVGQMWFRSDL